MTIEEEVEKVTDGIRARLGNTIGAPATVEARRRWVVLALRAMANKVEATPSLRGFAMRWDGDTVTVDEDHEIDKPLSYVRIAIDLDKP